MSVTKLKHLEGELMSQEDIDSHKISAKSSGCSCINCDPAGCFEKRKKAVRDRCQCSICRNLVRKPSTHTVEDKDSRNIKGDLESATKKIIREVVTRETVESLKRVTETMYEFGTNENFEMIMKRHSKLSDMKPIPTPTKSQISIKIECIRKRSLEDNNINSNKGCCNQRPIVQVSTANTTEGQKENYTATKLSAQVMNVPYEDLHEAVPSSHEITEQNPLSKLNIFKRIKEIYDACSCKVCECISSKPRQIREDFCNCKPCQCHDCVKLRRKIEEKIKRIPHSGCPCIRCDRKDCRGIAKNTAEPQACDCSPSDGIKYPEILTNRCKCEPCQCLNCKLSNLRYTSKTVKLGQVDAYIQRETCQCSPCECIECKQIYNRTNPTIMCTHVRSDLNKYGNFCRCHNCTERCQFGNTEICKCDSQNIPLRKSLHRKYNDYDIRTVMLDNNGPFNNSKESDVEKHNTVALFASLKNNYPSNSCNKGICRCTECECIVCSAKGDPSRNRKDQLLHNVMSLNNDIKLSTSITNACKCAPCECEICSKKDECEDHSSFERKCRCDVCDCLNCDNASLATSSFPSSSTQSHQSYSNYGHLRQPAKPIRSIAMNTNCNCNPCDCRNCKKLFSCSSSVKYYSGGKTVEKKTRHSRKVKLITPSTSQAHLKSQKVRSESSTLSPKESIESVFRQDLSTCHAVSHNYVPLRNLSHTNRHKICQLYQDNEYNLITDDDVDVQMLFKLNNPVLDTESLKSVEETPILNYPCNFNQNGFKSHKILNENERRPSEEKYKHYFNIIHEQPDKIVAKDSDESLPVFWACCDRTAYPRSNSRNLRITCERTLSNLKINQRNNTECSKNKQDDLNEKPTGKTRNQLLKYNKLKNDDTLIENINNPDSDGHHNYICNNERVNLPPEPEKYTDSNSSSLQDNKQEYGKVTLVHSDVSIDYERATRVLCEAKAFSSKLIKMLDSFETANKQFESASQKFKVLHESLLNINESELNKTNNTNLMKTPRPVFETTFEIISEDTRNHSVPADKLVKNENEAEREYEQVTEKCEDVSDNFRSPAEFSALKATKEIIVENIEIHRHEKSEIDENSDKTQKHDSHIQFQKINSIEILPTRKSFPENVSDFNDYVTKEINLNDEIKNNMENDISGITVPKPTISSVMKKLDSVFDNITTRDTSVATDDVKLNVAEVTKQEDKQTWQIFKKNLYLNLCPQTKRTIFQSSALELDIKEAIKAISLQTKNQSYATVVPRPNEALAHLQSEVNDLLNMPLLHIDSKLKIKMEPDGHLFPTNKLEVKSFSSSASSQTYDQIIKKADKEVYFNIHSEMSKVSCDQLKANFVGLRRVSDHTVLVKWNVPERVADVQGYELLVDGRAVQKIFSPTRCMAVVTCLPPAPRVLLTVRTIAAVDCGHAPATTIVYRPRMK